MAEESKSQGFTLSQLATLTRQIQVLHELNIGVRALKYKARTGKDLVLAPKRLPTAKTAKRKTKDAGLLGGRVAPATVPAAAFLAKKKRTKSETPSEEGENSASESSASDSEQEEEYQSSEDGEEAAMLADESPNGREGRAKASAKGGGKPARQAAARAVPRRKAAAALKSLAEAAAESDDDAGASMEHGSPLATVNGGGRLKVATDGAEGPAALTAFDPVRVAWATGDDAVCSVCGDGEGADDNAVLLCEGRGCPVAVHQQCYGVPKVPKGKWLCDGCSAGLKPDGSHCCVCPVAGGALRAVKSMGKVRGAPAAEAGGGGLGAAQGKKMVHLACALWTPEITIGDAGKMAAVSLAGLTPARQALTCALCKQQGGAVVQCSNGSCCRPFHVLCGRAAGNVLTFRTTDGEPLQFCSAHSGPRFAARRDAACDGLPDAAGEAAPPGDVPAAEPAELVEYEREREANVQRIEEMKNKLFGGRTKK